jgi:hypothetical protein
VTGQKPFLGGLDLCRRDHRLSSLAGFLFNPRAHFFSDEKGYFFQQIFCCCGPFHDEIRFESIPGGMTLFYENKHVMVVTRRETVNRFENGEISKKEYDEKKRDIGL